MYETTPRSAAMGARPLAAKAGILAAFLIATVAAVLSAAPVVVAASGLSLAAIIAMLWRADEPPILLLPPLFQWSEVALPAISTIWLGTSLDEMSRFGVDLEPAAFYGLASVTVLAVGLRLGAGRSRQPSFATRLRWDAFALPFPVVFKLALALMGAGYALSVLSGFWGPTRELFNQASGIKYAGFFMLAYWCLVRRIHLRLLAAVVLFEIIFGMTGFFAEFKNSLLTLLVAAIAARPRFTRGSAFAVVFAISLLLSVAVFWSAVKPGYRHFVNQGTGMQVILVPLGDRIEYLVDAAIAFDGYDISDGFERLVSRHGYIEFLGLTMKAVPDAVPHENGALTFGVVRHITMPRFLFPNKPPLPSDTEVMARYTGLPMLWDSRVSISIGHLGELYVDFGYIGGLVAIAMIGILVGVAYRVIRSGQSGPTLLKAGLAMMAVLPIAYFGTAYIKLVSAFIFAAAIAIAFQCFAWPVVESIVIGRQLNRLNHPRNMPLPPPR